MFAPCVSSRSRRMRNHVFTVLFAASFAALPAAIAQDQTQHASTDSGFTSSLQPATVDSESIGTEAGGMPAAPIAGGGQADRSYGSHRGGMASHLAFEAGGGVNAPIGNDTPFITWGGNLTVGAGLRFSRHLSLLAEYQFIDDKLPGGLIAVAGAQGGNAHIWSLTLDPVVDLFPAHKNDVYFTGGGGFYRKVTSFTDPEEVTFCDYFCYPGVENVTVSHFSSNQGGANLGMGFTHKLGSDNSLRAFAEARYLWINTPPIGDPNGLGATELIPVTLGLRW